MNLNFILEALSVLFVGYCLLRIAGKKTVGEMTGIEIITLLAMASMIGHAIAGQGLWKTLATLCVFIALLITIQFLSVKFDLVEKLFMGKATVVIQDGVILTNNLKKLRMSVDQLEAKLRTKGITSFADIKTATIEMSGQIGYEWMRQAKPVTIGELEKMLAPLQPMRSPQQNNQDSKLFTEVLNHGHSHSDQIPTKLD